MFWSCLSSSLAQGSHWRSILAKNHDSSMPSFCALLLAGARFIYSSNLLVVALTFTFFLATYLPSRKSVALLKLVRHDEISRIQLQALERTGVKSTVGCINVQVNMPYISFHPFTPPKKPNLSEVGFKPPNLWDFEKKYLIIQVYHEEFPLLILIMREWFSREIYKWTYPSWELSYPTFGGKEIHENHRLKSDTLMGYVSRSLEGTSSSLQFAASSLPHSEW